MLSAESFLKKMTERYLEDSYSEQAGKDKYNLKYISVSNKNRKASMHF